MTFWMLFDLGVVIVHVPFNCQESLKIKNYNCFYLTVFGRLYNICKFKIHSTSPSKKSFMIFIKWGDKYLYTFSYIRSSKSIPKLVPTLYFMRHEIIKYQLIMAFFRVPRQISCLSLYFIYAVRWKLRSQLIYCIVFYFYMCIT